MVYNQQEERGTTFETESLDVVYSFINLKMKSSGQFLSTGALILLFFSLYAYMCNTSTGFSL